jgi:hypothetical protein
MLKYAWHMCVQRMQCRWLIIHITTSHRKGILTILVVSRDYNLVLPGEGGMFCGSNSAPSMAPCNHHVDGTNSHVNAMRGRYLGCKALPESISYLEICCLVYCSRRSGLSKNCNAQAALNLRHSTGSTNMFSLNCPELFIRYIGISGERDFLQITVLQSQRMTSSQNVLPQMTH